MEPNFAINKIIYYLEIGNYLTSNLYGGLRLKFKLIEDNNLFKIDNYNIKVTVHIGLSTAILGGQVEYRTVKGIEKLTVPAKSQDGDLLIFKNQVMIILIFY